MFRVSLSAGRAPGRPKPARGPLGGRSDVLGAGGAPMTALLVLSGAQPLFRKEVLRFWKVSFQTVAAPVLTAVMYLVVFGHALNGRVSVYDGVSYVQFLIPGLVMMSVLQKAFANSSSSLIQSKVTGNLVFLLVTPLSPAAWFLAYAGAAVVRGMVVRRGGAGGPAHPP